MKKSVITLLILLIACSAVFAATPASVNLNSKVAPGTGVGIDSGSSNPAPPIGGASVGYGFYIYHGEATDNDNLINVKESVTDASLLGNGIYKFTVLYAGNELKGTSHTIKVTAGEWALKDYKFDNEHFAVTTKASLASDPSTSLKTSTNETDSLTTEFGNTTTTLVSANSKSPVGTFELTWDKDKVAVAAAGDYSTTITFTVDGGQ